MSDELTAALADFKVEEPPKSLFRFYRSELVSTLQRGRLNLTPPHCFNDPFEMWAGIKIDALQEEDVLRSVRAKTGLFRAALLANNPLLVTNEDQYVAKITAVVKTRPDLAGEHFQTMVDAIRHSCFTQFGVVCFSGFDSDMMSGPVGIRHWSMYGDCHRGFALEYDGHHHFFQKWANIKWLFPVQYLTERMLVSLSEFDVWDDAKMWKTFRAWSAMKSAEAWGHEFEWRIVCPLGAKGASVIEKNEAGEEREYLRLWREDQSNDEQEAGARAIRRVILGLAARKETKDAILSAAKDPKLAHVEIWQARACRSKFALVFERLH